MFNGLMLLELIENKLVGKSYKELQLMLPIIVVLVGTLAFVPHTYPVIS